MVEFFVKIWKHLTRDIAKMTGSLCLLIILEMLMIRMPVTSYPEYEWDDLEEGGDDAGKWNSIQHV